MGRYLSAKEAAEILGVNIQTIYAYVSRGMIRSEEASGGKRNRRYHAEDIDRLRMNKEALRNPDKTVSEALYWGIPLLESSLTLITDDCIYYRGEDALVLAETRSFEDVVSLLWTGKLNENVLASESSEYAAQILKLMKRLDPVPSEIQALQIAVMLASTEDATAYDLSHQGVLRSGGRILSLLSGVILQDPFTHHQIAEAIAEQWCPSIGKASHIINAALILCADHELNASSFAARVIAGAGASLYAVVNGALSAFQGLKHGSMTEQAGHFLAQIGEPAQANQVVAGWLKRGETIPGFGHPLYEQGDPRARKLLELLERHFPNTPTLPIVSQVASIIKRPPNIDIALAGMALTLNLSPAQGSLIFALGRCAGWIAHAIEQYGSQMIRPRARYVGVQPVSSY